MSDLIGETLLRMPEVCRRTGRTRDQVYRDIRAGAFPAPIKRERQSLWIGSEVQAVIDREIATLPRMQVGGGRIAKQKPAHGVKRWVDSQADKKAA